MSDYAAQILVKLGLTEPSARGIAPKLVIASYDVGQPVWLQNQMLGAWCFIMTGIVVGTSPRLGGQRLPMTLHGPQSWFGEVCLLNDEPTVLDYVCATDVQLIRMPAETFRQLVATEPALGAQVLRMTARHAQLQMDLIISLKIDSPTVRTVLGLAQIAEALSASWDGKDVLAVPIKQSLIAAMCGVSRTLLSHYLQVLQLAGWVRVHYSRLEMVAPRAWVRMAYTMHRHRLFERQVSIEEMVKELELAQSEQAASSVDGRLAAAAPHP
ncbi:Crp/Fnr family transcriptional regulator [uncultured Ramlibacter sp.]|uniref:Crp/Fnr family transcriptional regulator n=1 Tax=uncultured Ramlibacter sp. TaxID=260755 RepID=UPI002614121F|nr:Crp/Fnr family transcriptional regulator [uncultured Ramlibacter sp.]